MIKSSTSRQVASLIADLSSDTPATREAAVARLIVAGERAVEPLVSLVSSSAAPSARQAALRALEAIGDPRAVQPALDSIDDPDDAVAVAAMSTAGAFVRGEHGAPAIDRLTEAAVDSGRDARLRCAALRALDALDRSTLDPLWRTLAADREPAVQAVVAERLASPRRGLRDPAREIGDAARGALPDDPARLREAVAHAGDTAPLPQLRDIVERVREREMSEAVASRRTEWARARAAVHVALAHRDSRLALYDIRESLESAAAPLPVEFLAALTRVGDASCLDAIASAYVRARDAWWRQHLADAFRAIVRRERITRRHAVVRKIEKRWKDAFADLWAGGAGRP